MEKNQTETNTEISTEVKSEKKNGAKGSACKPVAVIVGASSGIGLELATALLSKGYTVVNVSRGLAKNERVKNITADVTQGEELEHALQAIGAEYKHVSLLVYSAGFSMAAPLEVAKEADIRYLFEVNYFGAIRAIRCTLPYMKKNGGKIFLISSLGSSYPIPFDSFYSSSKAALDMLVKGARTELRHYNITLTAVQPGGTSTSFTFKRKIYSDDENGEYAKDVHKAVAALANMEQGGMSPQEVADAVVVELLKNNPAITFVPGRKNKAYRLMSRWLPEKWTEYFNNKKYNQ
ncbi:MAG: SDR family NAD(P)-dependent oxidoreductase [Clostridia bacterium]|nr:SDR family NAD(P)-dependent oxidoreductase [Clostridia bacterium]